MFSRIFGFLFLSIFTVSCHSAELSFYSYDDAMELARSQGRNVYVLFGGEHCPWCHRQKEVLLRDGVADSLSDYLACHVDISEERALSVKYRVRSIPASFILEPDGDVVKKNVGYMDEQKFLNWLR